MNSEKIKKRFKICQLKHGEYNRDQQVKYVLDCGVFDYDDIIDIVNFIECEAQNSELYNSEKDNFIDTYQNYLKYVIESMQRDFETGALDLSDEYDTEMFNNLKKALKE